jgi:hypothetical protein
MSDIVGQRGEAIFFVLITKFYGRKAPIFRPQFLGDKWPNVDFIVELTNYPGDMTPYFFVQVKATTLGYTKREKRLKVTAKSKDIKTLATYPAPCYIVGIDEKLEKGFIVSANGESFAPMRNMPTDYPINKETQDMLWQEVKNFWENSNTSQLQSVFIDPRWG